MLENNMVLYAEERPVRYTHTQTLYRWEGRLITGRELLNELADAPLDVLARMGNTDERTAERMTVECTDIEQLAWFFNIDWEEIL